jgi:tetratricopeptide (TPR) repeat protein
MTSLPPSHSERIEGLLAKAEQLKIEGSYTDALVILENILLEDPRNVAALEEIADNELSREEFDRAFLAAEQAVTLEPESSIGHAVLGEIFMIRKEWELACEHLQIANKLLPSHPDTLRLLGWSLFRSGKTVEGIVTLERALNLDPDDSFIMCDLASAHMESGDAGKAKLLLDRAAAIDPLNETIREYREAAERMIA